MTTMESRDIDWKRLRRLFGFQAILILTSFAVLAAIWVGVRRLEVRQDRLHQQIEETERGIEETERAIAAKERELKFFSDLAANAQRELRQTQADLQTARDGLKEVRAQVSSRELQTEIDVTLRATEVTPPPRPVSPRIHILYANGGQQPVAARLAAALEEKKFTIRTVRSLQGTSGRPANDMTQVRFMHLQDRTSALDVLSVLQTNGIQHSRISYVPDANTPPGRIEVWFEAGDIR